MTALAVDESKPGPAKRRAGRSPFAPCDVITLFDLLEEISNVCGTCAGWRQVWCPGCCGFAGCPRCAYLNKVPCPACSGGTLERIRW